MGDEVGVMANSLSTDTVRQEIPERFSLNGERWHRLVRNLVTKKQGHVAILAALTILPIALIAGFAIDFQMLTTKKNKAQYTLDSAAIAGTRAYQNGASDEEVRQAVQTYFMSALNTTANHISCTVPSVIIEGTDVDASTECKMDTTLSAIAGIEEMAFSVDTATTFGIGKVDVAFVFDVSGSMDGSRIADLKVAAHDAVDTLLVENPRAGHEDDIRLSMVAYNGSFNAGSYFETVTNESSDQTYSYSYYGNWYSIPYSTTCVFERDGSDVYTDAAPGPDKYMMVPTYNQLNDYHNRYECSDAEPLELTSTRQTLHDYVDALDAGGNTAGHLGVAWGWYMISPNWSSILPADAQPLPYDEPDTAKAIVLMTDGAFNIEGDKYGNGSSSNQAKTICDNIKETGVVIYSVAFQAPEAGREVLEHCASDIDSFFTPSDGQQLQDAYQSIAKSISDLRITH